ncbi:hypothetical protein ACLB2K_006881 [Fragaria x ananassa]
MKREIAAFVSRCLICQQVKAERQKPSGLLEPLPVPVWKWDHITMAFVFSLPHTREGHDGIWVIVDRLTKSAHFLPVGKKFSLDKLAELFANEKIKVVRDRLKKLSPWKGVVRFGKRGKLSPRYIGPYEIIERVGSLAYRLALPSELSRIHNVFHVFMLRKYIVDPSQVLEEQPISLQKDLSYEEEPVHILDRKEQVNSARQSALEKPSSRRSYLGARRADEAAVSLSL